MMFISFFAVLLASAYYITANNQTRNITPGKYSIKILDSVQIIDDIGLSNMYMQHDYWIKMGMGKANFYEIKDTKPTLKASIRGATTLCPDPNKRISPKNLERARFFGVGHRTIITYDDLNQRIHIYDKDAKFIQRIKPDVFNKKIPSGCNYSQTNDTIMILSMVDMNKNVDSLKFNKNEVLYHIIDLKTGKTLYKAGKFPETYQEKKYLGYLPFHTFASDFKNKRIFYQCEGSPYIYVNYWESGKNEVFGTPCQNYTVPQFEIKQSSVSMSEYVSKVSEYRDKSCITNNIYYESTHGYIFRDIRLPKESDGLCRHVLQTYKDQTLLTEVLLNKKIGSLVGVSDDLSIWFENNRLPGQNNTILYKAKLVPEN